MTTDMIDIDEADILVLQRGLNKTQLLTNSLTNSLTTIQKSAATSHQLFAPILLTNQRLTILTKNIEQSLDSLSSIKDVATDASKHDLVLSQPIEKVGLSQFIKAIYKIEDLLENMDDVASANNSSNSSSTAEFHGVAANLQSTIANSERRLHQYLISLCNSIQPFDPQLYINKRLPFPYYEDLDLQEMKQILEFFQAQNKYDSILDLIIQQRSQFILKCMAFLEEFTKELTKTDNAPYEKGTSGILNYTEALTGVIPLEENFVTDLQLEKGTLVKILTPVISSFSKICQSNMKKVSGNMVNLGLFTFELDDCITKVIKALKNISLLQDQLVLIRQKCQQLSINLLDEMIIYINKKATNLNSLPSDFGITETTVDIMSKLRRFSDYQKEELTVLKNNPITIQSWLPGEDTKWYKAFHSLNKQELSNNTTLSTTSPEVLLSCFIGDCLDDLCVSLEMRAAKLLSQPQQQNTHHYFHRPSLDGNDGEHIGGGNGVPSADEIKSLVGFFLVTNITLMEQILARSADLNTMLNVIPQRQPRIMKLKRRYLEYFLIQWKKITQSIMSLCTTAGGGAMMSTSLEDTPGGKTKKDKEHAKDVLRVFNEKLDELLSGFKRLKISDPGLKKWLVGEIKGMLEPVYKLVWNRYKDGFKHRQKHLKYSPEDLSSLLNGLSR
ncbi:GTP-Rho binding exocyst subunit EXO70 SCDLUD_003681 [Saccharomycodes ludwigii]|uniref:GTP-Rho binding exocyst subunit EXO70 n=1 Tax=Saccharomycodes ludwigii TaxID=36035 RepID=UPI001E8B01A6|nr:hypothetical protein SCDLUD_003681 [Saccharomycodes ludwigii]KAH3900682.1 hypothetical protein SCDLUD_003681 [Saccharomycodes ludwigii]